MCAAQFQPREVVQAPEFLQVDRSSKPENRVSYPSHKGNAVERVQRKPYAEFLKLQGIVTQNQSPKVGQPARHKKESEQWRKENGGMEDVKDRGLA